MVAFVCFMYHGWLRRWHMAAIASELARLCSCRIHLWPINESESSEFVLASVLVPVFEIPPVHDQDFDSKSSVTLFFFLVLFLWSPLVDISRVPILWFWCQPAFQAGISAQSLEKLSSFKEIAEGFLLYFSFEIWLLVLWTRELVC